jgi:ABC-2 type transport system ATP-binding protein
VGIIDGGRLVAEGTPEDLKQMVGTDLISAKLAGDLVAAAERARAVDGVKDVEIHHDELAISVVNGARAISYVVAALNDSSDVVREITLRTPTLDDVFLEMTGHRIQPEPHPPSDAS